MTDASDVAACRAALLAYASAKHGTKDTAVLYGDRFVRVDDAVAVMAEREAKLREALREAVRAVKGLDSWESMLPLAESWERLL